MVCLLFTLSQSAPDPGYEELFKKQLNSSNNNSFDTKYLKALKYKKDNSTWVFIDNVLYMNDLDKKQFTRAVSESIKLNSRSFQELYKCMTSLQNKCSFNGYNRSRIDVTKFYEGSLPFRLTILEIKYKDEYKNDTTVIYRGINLDGSEYIHLLSLANKVMRLTGL